MKKLFTLFAAMVTFVALNAQTTADLEVLGFTPSQTSTTPVQSIDLGSTDDLSLYILFRNNGPATPAANDTILLATSINGEMVPAASLMALGSQLASLPLNTTVPLGTQGGTILTADQLNDMVGEGSFELCMTVYLFGETTDDNAANNTACVTINRGTTGINEVAEGQVNVYPNPATTVINIDNAEGAQVSVFDINGRMISNIESASANQTIDASNFAKGMYIVRIANGNNVITKKVSVVR